MFVLLITLSLKSPTRGVSIKYCIVLYCIALYYIEIANRRRGARDFKFFISFVGILSEIK